MLDILTSIILIQTSEPHDTFNTHTCMTLFLVKTSISSSDILIFNFLNFIKICDDFVV